MTADRALVRSPLAARLVAGFVAVAVAAVFAIAGMALWRNGHSVGQLARERQHDTTDLIADTLALDYQQHGGWLGADTHSAVMLASQAGALLTVTDANDVNVELTGSMGGMPHMATDAHGPTRVATVTVDGRTVGTVHVTFVSGALADAERHVRDAMSGTVLIGSIVAALVALAVAVPIARRIVRPLRRVTDAARKLGDGDADARAGEHDAPGELGALNQAFDAMADRLQANDVARRNLAADVAHELRTPLTLLQGGCEEVIDGITEPSMDHFVQMHDDVLRLRRLVDDLAMLADADAALAGPTVRTQRCNLAEVAEAAADSVRPLVDGNHQHLLRRLDPTFVSGDPARLGQIAINLLTNAARFTQTGGTITITVEHDPTTGSATMSVSDNGPGIALTDRAHVFERFYRGDSGIGGSGIGLAVVDQLVRAHHGTVAIADTRIGTTVVVALPWVG
ncbi:MAG: HAMP domain-containing protein [Actinobacteria bacterium]|uniref:histidine kinase n=1 Tax=freshwater metagenome TaxID=449393 RepID=A0A6J7BZR3_9ZZZZ|nr:HAMP domain-containing protein [Actinomycetota bacterium]MSW76798.1 HAMP domain-containing protein [Actinomycetota bacterium]MSX54755.1 HAMP domain-containing protein [Actinomycetota bacterium]MSX92723.1 HAMP domain-containing protein [Actinomycetota bacterium]MSZ82245.1 HAMP domain-containing protein [Actinomycetota bacterium]